MITIVDVVRAFSNRLENLLGAPPVTKDLVEVKDRPCTYLQAEEVTGGVDAGLWHDVFPIQIAYFAPFADRGYLDLLRARQLVSVAMAAPTEVGERFHLLPEDVEITLYRDDMILVCNFTVECWQEMEEDWTETGSGEIMEHLEAALERKETGSAAPAEDIFGLYLTDEDDGHMTDEDGTSIRG